MNWLDFVFSFALLVFLPLPNSAAKEDPVASSRTVFLSRYFTTIVMVLLITTMMMVIMMMMMMIMMMMASYGDQRKIQWQAVGRFSSQGYS